MKRVIKNILGLIVVCVFAACSKSSDEDILPPPVYEYEENPTMLEGTLKDLILSMCSGPEPASPPLPAFKVILAVRVRCLPAESTVRRRRVLF